MATADENKVHARYSLVERRIWRDTRGLTKTKPSGLGLWLYLLTSPHLGVLPGLLVATEGGIANDLEWSVSALRRAFAELETEGMAIADWKAGLIILPKVLSRAFTRQDRRQLESPNVIRGWHRQWLEVPECALKARYHHEMRLLVVLLGEAYTAAFDESICAPLTTGTQSKPWGSERRSLGEFSANQEQDTDSGSGFRSKDQIRVCALGAREGTSEQPDTHTGGSPGAKPAKPRSDFAADLLAALREFNLIPLAVDSTYADEMAMILFARGVRMAEARRAIGDFATKFAGRTRSMTHDEMSDKLGGFFTNAKISAQRSSRDVSPEIRNFMGRFAAGWKALHGRDYASARDDVQAAETTWRLAAENLASLGSDAKILDVIGHWVRSYLADRDRYLTERCHPLSLLPSRVSSYGLPRAQGGVKNASPVPEAPVTPAERAEAVRAAKAALGALPVLGESIPDQPIRRRVSA